MIHAAAGRRRVAPTLAAAGVVWSVLGAQGCLERRTADASPARVPELTIGYADPRPRVSVDRGIATIVNNLTSERLLSLGRDGRPEAALVERWQESPDGLTWRFTLRKDLRLQDGSPLDAPVVRDWLTASLRASADQGGLFPGLRGITSIEAPGPLEFVVHLSQPDDLLLEGLAYTSPQGGRDGNRTAGPFRIDSRDREGVKLSAFPDYYRGRPRLERIQIREFPSARNAWGAMMRGELDFLYDVPPEALEFIEQSSTTFVATFLRPYVTTLVFNEAHPVLGLRDVRVALNAAVNRTEIIKVALRGRGYPATDHVWPKHWAYDPLQPRFRYDAARAAALLDAQGLRPDRLHGRDRGARFAFTCLVPGDEPRFEQVALLVQRQLVEVGVDMQLESVPVPVLQQRLRSGTYDAFLFELGSGHGLGWAYWFWHSSSGPQWVTTGYRSADAALEAVRGARTDDGRRDAVRQLRRAMHTDPPGAFLYWSESTRAVSRRFDIPHVPDRDILFTVSQWRLAPPVD
jgi:peptide/nickel transport system substrate-binding protein